MVHVEPFRLDPERDPPKVRILARCADAPGPASLAGDYRRRLEGWLIAAP